MRKLAQYRQVRCPICYANIETDKELETCPSCKEYIADKISVGDAVGITTATASGPGLKPLSDLKQDVY